MARSLTADLQRALLRELVEAWQQINRRDFGGVLRPPVVALHEHQALGGFTPTRRQLTLNRSFVVRAPWGQVIEVLRHEVAHQFVHEALHIHDEPPHGPTFRRICRERGIDARAAGLPHGAVDAQEERLVRRVRALLRLAESPEPHEAAAAATAARRLLATHDLDLTDPSSTHTFRQVGPTKGRFDPWEKVLGGVLSSHFGVTVIYALAYRPLRGTWGRVLEVMGPAHHVEVAAYVHDVLRSTGEHAWKTHKRRQGITSDAERRRYLFGVMAGFKEALDKETPDGETGLVHVEHAAVEAYVRQRYPHLRAGRTKTVKISKATAAGREVGRKIQIRPGVAAKEGGPKRITRKE